MSIRQKITASSLPPEVVWSFMEESSDCISLIDPKGFIKYSNPIHKKVFGYLPEELMGLHIIKLPFHTKTQGNSFNAYFDKLVSGKTPEILQYQLLRKDRETIWIETSATLIHKKGELFLIQLISRDITQRILTEKKLQKNARDIEQLFESIPDPVLLHQLNPDGSPGRIIMCNDRASELTGFSRKEILRMNITEIGHPESGLKDGEMLAKISEGNPVLFERIVVKKDKSIFPVEVHGRLFEYKGEKIILSLLRDITERKKVEEDTHLHLMFEKIVSDISNRFVNMPDSLIDKGIEKTLKEVSEFIGAMRGVIFLLSENNDGLTISHDWCSDINLRKKPMIQHFSSGGFSFIKTKLMELEDIVLDQISELPKEAIGEKEWFKKIGFNPIFYVPIISENKPVGALGFSAENNLNHKWPKQYGYLLRYIATVLYNALSRKEMGSNLRRTQLTIDRYSEAVFWLSLPEFKVVDINPSACISLGYKREELLEMTVFDFAPEFTPERSKNILSELKRKNLTFESKHRKKNKEEFPIEITASFIVFEEKEYVVAFSRDISERKAAEQIIIKSEQQYRNIFENVVDIFYEASLDGKLLNVTPSVERITKYNHKDLIGQSMEIFYHNPAIREPLLKSLYESGEVQGFEMDVKDIDGSTIPCSLNSKVIFNEDGKPERIVGSLTDLRHRKKAETQINQLSTALQQIPVSVIITDTKTRILYVNDSFSRFSGMEPDEIIGNTPYEISRGQIPLNNYNEIWVDVQNGKLWNGELKYLKRNGADVWLSITVSPVLGDSEEVINFVGIIEEITERKISEQNLRKAKEEAEKSDLLKSAFLANMSHEIRTPMNAILGFSSLLREGNLDIEQSEYYIDIINSKGRDLLRIISDIIDISRIEAGDLYIKIEPVEIYPFILEIYNEFKEDTQVKSRMNMQFRLNVPKQEKKIIINTDPSRLKQVFVNLIQNALKFTHDGYVELGFEILENNIIQFFTRDSGIGIPEEKTKIIFERFRQIDDSNTREYGGTGLGLAICKNLLELMGSELFLKSKKNQGSYFYFHLKHIYKDFTEKKALPEEGNQHKQKLNLKGKKILIVEDDGSSYLFLETLINKYSPEILWAKSGKQAINMINKYGNFDLILMDIRMPEMDGMTATREIRKKYPDLPIIAQTAYAQVTDRKIALESGCNDYLSKPVSPVELRTLLAKYLTTDA